MFEQNGAYGHKLILQRYCQVRENLPVWGEIQHSFWATEPKWKAKHDRYFPTNFTWNDLLSLPRQVPIGDPWFYLSNCPKTPLNFGEKQVQLLTRETLSIVFPQQTGKQESINDKIKRHRQLLETTITLFPNNKVLVFLHPVEESNLTFQNLYSDYGNQVTVIKRRALDAVYSARLTFEYLNSADAFFTNYQGAHLVRRCLSGQERTFVMYETGYFQGASVVIRNLLSELSMSTVEDRVEIAKILLGWKFKQSKEELASMLGFVGIRSFFGPILKSIHNKAIYR